MFSLRQAAVRVISARSSSFIARPKTFTTASFIASKPSRITSSVAFQRRWASNETKEQEQDEPLPVSELQPTPQEEVENTIHEENASVEAAIEAAADPAGSTQAQDTSEAAFVEQAEQAEPAVDEQAQSSRPPKREGRVFSEREPLVPRQTIYVGNLFFDVTENDLSKEFGRYGTVEAVKLVRDGRGLSKGFGYVKFSTIDEATTAINEMNQQLFEGRRILVNYSATDERPKKKQDGKPVNPPSKTLFIGNMSYEMTDRDLNSLFKGIRNVIDVRVAIDRRTGQPRGFAHADFVDVKSAVDAASILSEKESYGRRLRIDYSTGASAAPRNAPR